MQKLRNKINGTLTSLYFTKTLHHLHPFSTSTTTSTQPKNPNFTQYLTNSLGITTKQAHNISTKLSHIRQLRGTKNITNFTTLQLQNANNVISYFKQIGAQHSLIISTISSAPEILFCKVDKTLKPKTQFFIQLGFSGSEFLHFFKANLVVRLMGLETAIVPAYQDLKGILGSDELVVLFLKKFPRLRLNSVSKTLLPNVALLRSFGVSNEAIKRKVLCMPCPFFRNPGVFKEAVVNVEKMLGILRDSPQFLMGVHLLSSLKPETIEAKKEVFRGFGWSERDIVELCRTNPLCFAFSNGMIEKKLRFLMGELGYEPRYLMSKILLFTCSLEKRILPRYKVLVVLKEKGLIKEEYTLCKANCLSEDKFLERFVIPYEEVHEVYGKYTGTRSRMLRKLQNCT